MHVGIQGVRASFHDVAARKHFHDREVEPVECASFPLLCEALAASRAERCLMAIENSIAGSILPNYSLLESYGFKILGEEYLRIEMCLMALPGQRLEELQTVRSHPMALLQCEEFLNAHPHLQRIEASDTADSARLIREEGRRGHAAIASELAAQTYGLEVLRKGIETNRQNYTRFLVICRRSEYRAPAHANKASMRFEAAHRPGSLAAILALFSEHGVNLTKIQSVPILGKPYEYSFHVDLEWDDPAGYRAALAALPARADAVIHFGEYPRGERPGALP